MMLAMMERMTTEQYARLEVKELMRVLSARAQAAGVGGEAELIYQSRWGSRTGNALADFGTKALEVLTKAAVSAGSTTDGTWAGPLVAPARVSTSFLTLLERQSVIGKLPVVRVPFNVAMTTLTSGSSTAWVGEGVSKPISKMAFVNTAALKATKCSSIVVTTRELMKFSEPGSEEVLQTVLANELVAFVDSAFLGSAAATVNNPAGLLNGVVASADLPATVAAFFTARPYAAAPTWIVSAAKLGTLAATDPNVPTTYRGLPIVLAPAAGANAILLDAAAIAVADGGVVLDASDAALVQLDDAPVPPVAATLQTSLWQMNLSAIRAERTIAWAKDVNSVQFAVLP
jgi:Phage capsid family